MKKFFSAILLMTMMVFSVGTFVSCNDLVEEVETIKGQTSDIEAQISALETQIAALETALKGEIKSAADLAKAEAIAAAKAECETLKALLEAGAKDLEDYIALTNAKIEAIDADLAKMATKVELEEAVKELVAKDTELSMQITALEAYKAIAAANHALEAIEKFEADGRADEVRNARGEALLCRAYAHFMLANLFCMPYNPATADTELGVPYATEPETTLNPLYHRGTLQETYDKIEADLLEGLDLLPASYAKAPAYHFTRKAAYVFASRFY